MSRGRYLTADRLAVLGASLTPADRAVLDTLSRVRVATSGQLARLHCRDFTGRSAARQCNRRLGQLADRGVLARLDGRGVGGRGGGSASTVFTIGLAGLRLLSTPGRARRPWTPGRAFLRHSLEVAELLVALREAEHDGRASVVGFEAEPVCWRSFGGPFGEPVTLKPDAAVVVAGPASAVERHWLVEVDLATVGPQAVARKLDLYRRYWLSGEAVRRYGVHPLACWLVPDRKRHDWLVDQLGRQPAEAWGLFRVGVLGDAVAVLTEDRQ